MSKRPPEEPSESQFLVNASDVITFRMLEGKTTEAIQLEFENGGCQHFPGEFFLQQFGEEEKIKGYQGLVVNIWFSCHTYHAWLDVKWSKRKPGADKILVILQDSFPLASPTKEAMIDSTVKTLEQQVDILAHGERLTAPMNSNVNFVKYTLASTDPASSYVREIHRRMEPLLLFFIDGASSIDSQDAMWEVILAVRGGDQGGAGEGGSPSGGPSCSPGSIMAVQTMYNFWTFVPNSQSTNPSDPAPTVSTDWKRLRLSQVLVLPPWQGLGVGKALLSLAYDQAKVKGCHDLTLEDPSPQLQRLREKLEADMILKGAPWITECIDSSLASPNLAAPSEVIGRITREFKINKRAARMVWELLLFLRVTSGGGGGKQGAENLDGRLKSFLKARLIAETFGTCDPVANDAKKVTDVGTDGRSFVMLKDSRGGGDVGEGGHQPANGEAGTSAAAAAAGASLRSGRSTSAVTVSLDEREATVEEMLQERIAQLEVIQQLIGPPRDIGEPSLNS